MVPDPDGLADGQVWRGASAAGGEGDVLGRLGRDESEGLAPALSRPHAAF